VIAQHRGFNAAQLDRFRAGQRASYAVLEAVAAELTPGITERETTLRITRAYRALGVTSYFHLPVALFGARTALPGRWRLRDFWPTRNRLNEGDSIILDASPIFDGYLVDTSFSTRLGDNADHHRMMMDLAGFRDLIAARAREGAPFRVIAIETDEKIRSMGYENRHRAHLEEVLGHRAIRLRRPRPNWVQTRNLFCCRSVIPRQTSLGFVMKRLSKAGRE